ncbi:DUF302 domain-containing protein [Tropicimonas marinistellae]|uniref:DUF302 domain-containing protein n=1 Tax=Tropicimonas marinistellae TaxID=1739787 RepID=UPI0008357377|nr:DUF302 domain-containing protein [Tropicimonas marinistellae]
MKRLIPMLAAAGFALAAPATAQEAVLHDFDGSFDDAAFAVESAIVGQGLVIDYVSHVGDMLNRTGADVGSDVKIFEAANVYLFCSATVSRSVMEADPMNVIHCPYNVFVVEMDGKVQVGHRTYPDGPMQEVQALLDGIVQEAMGE